MTDVPETIKMETTDASAPAKWHREESNSYPAVIAKLNPNWRVILCRDGIQWILQRKAGLRHGQPRWEGHSYLVLRKVLLELVHELVGQADPIALAALEELPEQLVRRP